MIEKSIFKDGANKNLTHPKLEKGITLIALIITIIILLILAVVAIGAVNNTGIIDYAQNSKKTYIDERDNENLRLQNYIDVLNEHNPNKKEESDIPNELVKYILGPDGEGRDLFGIAEEDDGAWNFVQDPIDSESTMHTQVKFVYDLTEDDADGAVLSIRYNREIYKFDILPFENETTDEVEFKTVKESLVKISSVPEGNLGKYVTYENNTWIVLKENNEKVELISANALGAVTLGRSSSNVDDEASQESRGLYNNVVEILVDVCKTETGITSNIRNVGGPASEGELSNSNTIIFSEIEGFEPTTNISKCEGKINGFRKEDTNYVSDYEQMKKIGILQPDNSDARYWFASRVICYNSDIEVAIGVREIDHGGCLAERTVVYVGNNATVRGSSDTRAVRPVITIDAEMLKGAIQSGSILDPIVLN